MLSDPRRFSRIVAAVALILGPIVVLAGMIATPWEDEATTASYHDALAANAAPASLATLLHFGFVLLLPAALGLMHLARRATPKLAHVGGLLAVGGLATLPGLLVTDFYDLALAQACLARSGRDRRRRRPGWAPALMFMSGVLPVFIGTVVLVVAAWRAGVAQGWMPFDSRWAGWRRSSRAPASARRRRRDPAPRRVRHDRRQGRPHQRSGVGRAAGDEAAYEPREGAEDRGRERRLSREVPGVRRAGGRLGHTGPRQQVRPRGVPVVERLWSSSGWNWTPHARRPRRKPSARPPPASRSSAAPAAARSRPRSSAGRGTRRQCGEHRVLAIAERHPGHQPARQPRDLAAVRAPAVAHPGRRRARGLASTASRISSSLGLERGLPG